MPEQQPEKSRRGFASMDPQRRRDLAARGGQAAHRRGTARVWTPAEAREAGRKGGATMGRDREHMSVIGKEGGRVRREAMAAARAAASAGSGERRHDRPAPEQRRMA
jgi:general stress protein YciG